MIKRIAIMLAVALLICLIPAAALGLGTADVNSSPTIRVLLGSSYSADSFSFTVTNGTYYIVDESALNGNNYYKRSMTAYEQYSSGSSFSGIYKASASS